jgi:4,5:9,10-diseco-3-hydroxy-5,9,17-trioxoandrosta-1(10),2-diene-4-oate hydrolase
MTGLREATYSVDGGFDIHLKEAGAGPVVVFIHGSGPGASGASNFRQNWPIFVAAGYRVICPT